MGSLQVSPHTAYSDKISMCVYVDSVQLTHIKSGISAVSLPYHILHRGHEET